MVRRVPQKSRGRYTRRERRLMLLVVEGERNRTETNYFRHFNALQKEYQINIVPGNETDPIRMAERAEKAWITEACDETFGDCVFCVFDTDTDVRKQREIEQAIKRSEQGHCEVILSNPCIEVWFILHYGYSSRLFQSNNEVIRKLNEYIPNYKKSTDVFETLSDHIDDAIKNARRLEEHHRSIGNRRGMESNPCTDVYRIVERLI